ncbi:MAG: hypothetical protein HeimC2_04620 [Candidatus Heimdallarchaeota archaeon LC_2]|nr:MAG: hypothetical protein HeimC2_04620 [Candidatus Heimdallarchaeota archaeon LC_2]
MLAIDVSLAGCAGDMLIAATIGLFNNPDEILSDISSVYSDILNQTINLTLQSKNYQDFQGYQLNIDNEYDLGYEKIKSYILTLCDKLQISSEIKKATIYAFELILESEILVHNKKEVHLHELGTSDTLIDIITFFYLIHKLNLDYIQISPIALGEGTVSTSHGILPIPTPVTSKLIEKSKLVTCIGPSPGEAATPTGISILASLKLHFQNSHQVIWNDSALGFGRKTWDDRGNFLRIRIGTTVNEHSSISVLESNVDDVSSEILGYTLEKLLKEGALDVHYFPIMMKKSRPAFTIKVICKSNDEERIANLIMKLTGTLGVRINSIDRHLGSREFITQTVKIDDKEFTITIKKGKYRSKIEFEDIRKISEDLSLSPIVVESLLNKQLLENENND